MAIVTAELTTPEFKSNPILWASKKGHKIVPGNIMDVQPHPDNIRWAAGHEYFGIKVAKSTLDLEGMCEDIREAGCIHTPIVVSKRKDGKKYTLVGNRRTWAGQMLVNDPKSTQELVESLKTAVPMIILEDLTPEQEIISIQDQTQKKFMRSELVRHVFDLFKMGMSWERMATTYYEKFADLTNNPGKLADIREIADVSARREAVKTWLRGTLNDKLQWGYQLGPVVQKCMLLSYMRLDGVQTEGDEKPYFIFKSPKQVALLRAARIADGSKWNGTMLIEGSEFKKVMDQLRSESYDEIATADKPKTVKMRDAKTIKAQIDVRQSQAMKLALQWCMGEDVDLSVRDDFAAVQEAKEMLTQQYLPRLKPSTAQIAKLSFTNSDPSDYQTFLEQNVVGVQIAETVKQTPPDNTKVEDGTYELGTSQVG